MLFALILFYLLDCYSRSLIMIFFTCCNSLPFVVFRCHSLSFDLSLVVSRCHCCTTRCNFLYHALSLVVIRCTTPCHSLSLVVIRCITRLSFYKRSIQDSHITLLIISTHVYNYLKLAGILLSSKMLYLLNDQKISLLLNFFIASAAISYLS